jgi:hypothetical protein
VVRLRPPGRGRRHRRLLAGLDVSELERALQAIADHAADRLAEELREAMERTRGG